MSEYVLRLKKPKPSLFRGDNGGVCFDEIDFVYLSLSLFKKYMLLLRMI